MMEQLPDLLSAVVNEGFSLAALAGGSVAGFAVKTTLSQYLTRRTTAAREILLEQLRAGEARLPPAQIDEGVAIVYRYFRAAIEGSARLNLRLMAQVIAGKAHLRALSADEFLHDADMIASLRREEVILLATLHRAWHSDWLQENALSARFEAATRWAATKLVPGVFRDRDEMEATAGGLVRTGLLTMMPLHGSIACMPTSLLDRLIVLAPFEAALEKEPN